MRHPSIFTELLDQLDISDAFPGEIPRNEEKYTIRPNIDFVYRIAANKRSALDDQWCQFVAITEWINESSGVSNRFFSKAKICESKIFHPSL